MQGWEFALWFLCESLIFWQKAENSFFALFKSDSLPFVIYYLFLSPVFSFFFKKKQSPLLKRVNCSFALYLKSDISEAQVALLVKGDESDLLLSLFLKEPKSKRAKSKRGKEQIPNPEILIEMKVQIIYIKQIIFLTLFVKITSWHEMLV